MLTEQQARRIEEAVKNAEATTSAEIAVCILPASGEDHGIAAIVSTIVFAAIVAGGPLIWWNIDRLIWSGIAIAVAIVAFWLCDHFDLGLRCLPARLLIKDARRAARTAFLDHGLDNSPQRNAVMLFVSRAERYIEILPDRAAAAAIEPAQWAGIVDEFRQRMRAADLGEAVAGAVAKIGALCAGRFPSSGARADRVSNRPIQE
jgi:putative membrane protein